MKLSDIIFSICVTVYICNSYLQKMLKLKYDPVHGYDYSYDTSDSFYIPDYRIHKPYDFYFDWPWRYRVWFPNRAYRRFLNKEFRVSNFCCCQCAFLLFWLIFFGHQRMKHFLNYTYVLVYCNWIILKNNSHIT